jgi:hypothetical protein
MADKYTGWWVFLGLLIGAAIVVILWATLGEWNKCKRPGPPSFCPYNKANPPACDRCAEGYDEKTQCSTCAEGYVPSNEGEIGIPRCVRGNLPPGPPPGPGQFMQGMQGMQGMYR